jgi:hypothetical protein
MPWTAGCPRTQGDFPEASRSVPFEGQHGFVIMMADALESLRQIAAVAPRGDDHDRIE